MEQLSRSLRRAIGAISAGAGMLAGAVTVGAPTVVASTAEATPVYAQATPVYAQATPVYGGQITVAGEAEVQNPWTPAAMQCDSYCLVRARTFFDQLAIYNEDRVVVGLLAESFQPNDDHTEWTVTLREGISFTDGTPVDAEAVIYNLQAAGTSILLASALDDVAKVADPDDPDREVLKIEQVDDLSFTVYLGWGGDPEQPRPWPTFPAAFTTQWGLIASMEWLQAVEEDPELAARPVGSGPFIVGDFSPRESLVVLRNPDYWMTDDDGNQLPYLDAITFRVISDSDIMAEALRAGDLDAITTSGSPAIVGLLDDDDFTVHVQDEYTETNYLLINLDREGALQDARVRCAMWLAIDRDEIRGAIESGFTENANGLFSPGQQGYLDDNGMSIEQDLDAARALIEEYEGDTGERASFRYGHTPPAGIVLEAELLMGWWREAGIDVESITIPQPDLISMALFGHDDFDVFRWRLHSGVMVSDQQFWWHSTAAAPLGELALNFSRLRDPDVDAGLEDARSAATYEEGLEAAERVNRTFAEQCYSIPLHWTKWGIATSADVAGYGLMAAPGSDAPALQSAGMFWSHTLYVDG